MERTAYRYSYRKPEDRAGKHTHNQEANGGQRGWDELVLPTARVLVGQQRT
jgi:hypothetical protein